MFSTFFKFELNYWLKGAMVYIFLLIITILITLTASIDEIVLQSSFANINRNSPYVIQFYYGFMAILTCLMTTAFVNDAASRDFAYQTDQLIFTKPINKFSFLLARFWGSVLIAIVPMLGVTLGILLAPSMSWVNADSFGSSNWSAHLWAVLIFAIPNTIFIAAIIFAIAIWLRSTFASFIGVIVLLTAYGISQSITGSLENETLVQLADPFGLSAFEIQTKYWTVSDRNSSYLTYANWTLLLNRLIWVGVGLSIMGIACWRFTFAQRRQKSKTTATALGAATATAVTIPKVAFNHGFASQIKQFFSQLKLDFLSTIKSPVFIVVVLMAMIDTFTSLRMIASEGFGLKALPVTYSMIQVINGSLFLYLIIVITFYAGVLVWKEREAKLDGVLDALPHSNWISYLAKLVTILLIILIVISAEILISVVVQASEGYSRFQLGLYARELLGYTFMTLFCFTVLAFLCHIISPNKYIGYFVFIVVAVANLFAWDAMDIESRMVQFGFLPNYIYSDMFKFAPFSAALSWFSAYWVLFCVFLSCIGLLLWQRGGDRGFFKRISIGLKRFIGPAGIATAVAFFAWAGTASWVYYNTQIRNSYTTENEQEALQGEYEKSFKEYASMAQPRVISVKYDIDVYPEKRGLVVKAEQVLVNKTDEPIEEVFLNLAEDFETTISIDGAKQTYFDENYYVQIYEFETPLQPGEQTKMNFTVSFEPKGFENAVSNIQIVQNGTFFSNTITPQIGYQPDIELTDKDDREHWDLKEKKPMAALDPKDMAARANTYISNNSDWVDVETVISTSKDQIAVAPGSLVRKWEKDGRRYFHYKVDHKSLNMYSFISADYKVRKEKWKGVDIEVYYHAEHEWNVGNMLRSIAKSLEYYSEAFGPYEHKQARIIEFPRISSFAQAFPGTMPYSEGIGFIASIKESDDIDMVYYVVAHEMAHQWWAHQIVGADMEGATMLSETLAQYSALMVMEKEFGRDLMRKFLKYEMDRYLTSRSSETMDEQPLMKVYANQGYIHYQKGTVAMYYLKEMIGEDKVNAALRSLIDKFAYSGPPYPTSIDLVDALREQTPEKYHYLMVDLFEKITLFENRTLKSNYEELPDGKFKIDLEIECKKYQADEKGEQTEVAINDWIEIGAFAEPEDDSEFGKTLYRERVKIEKSKSNFSFVVDELPAQAGVDPFSLLVDRSPDDNMKRPKLQAAK